MAGERFALAPRPVGDRSGVSRDAGPIRGTFLHRVPSHTTSMFCGRAARTSDPAGPSRLRPCRASAGSRLTQVVRAPASLHAPWVERQQRVSKRAGGTVPSLRGGREEVEGGELAWAELPFQGSWRCAGKGWERRPPAPAPTESIPALISGGCRRLPLPNCILTRAAGHALTGVNANGNWVAGAGRGASVRQSSLQGSER